ncbi:sulfonate transport system ATP-binding protein [Kushneria avicenniae]|uniref:Sulfonate transport system ATP-binding protein n=1 Tax=Kushneria avicenniae TaxID=402385 RepID=A0A1I1LPS4_9GAMM|nr:ATP-binding cassette domain-containing protein [Kushneria avicenniae]SFC72293.1 sulfonate transport system ATP-binding protein [Kushneria avicenniae]
MSTQSLHLREVSRHQDHTVPSNTDDRTAPGLALSLDAVDKSFGEHRVLKQIDLEIPSGQIVAIVGRSGCGKSTLLRIIAGLESHSGGHIHTGDGARTGNNATADQTRMMFQDDRLLPWKTVINNVGLGLSGNWKPRALEALAEVGLVDHADKWPAQLSGGQKQRVALARAMIHQPRLLLLDEPLGALDALTRLEMQQLIERLWQQHGFTILLVTHDVAEAVQLGDRVIVLESGVVGMDLPVSLARPREHASPGLAAMESTVLHRVLARESTDEPHHDERRHDTRAPLRWAL